ncbi:hypothetical protein WMF30_02065 [Sorangium sp. So ce134]
MWIADRVTGKTVLREMTGSPADGGAADGGAPDPDAALALRVVELLRASLLEASLPSPPPGELPATPEIRERMRVPAPAALAGAPTPTLRFSLGPGALLSPGGLGVSASADLGLSWMPSEHAGVVALAAIPLSSARLERSHQSVDLSALLAGGGVRFTSSEGRLAPAVDLGLAVVSLWSSGMVVSSGFTVGDSTAVTVAPFVRFGAAFAVTPGFRLRADVLAGMFARGVSIQIAEHDVVTWGQPILLTSAGVDFGWF